MSRQLQYDKVALENAVKAVTSKSMGYLKASKSFNVPRSTIFDKVKGNSTLNCTSGPHLLTMEEEKRLANWMIDMSQIGYGRSKPELLETVQKIIISDGRKTPFKNGRPGKDWYYGFMKRHLTLSLRAPRQLGKERAVIRPEYISKWFDDYEQFIKDTVDDENILFDPSRIYNADESGFSLCAQTGHVIGLKGSKSVYNISASDKSQITVLCGMSASGHFLRPMIVFPGQRFTRNMLEGFDEAVLGRSMNGWMDSELFVSWLEIVFVSDIDRRQVKRPVILLVDGHKTHVTLEASDVCKDNGIILYCLLAHASHLIQPCDLRLFGPLKETWKSSLREWQIDHVGQYVTKFQFAAIFKQAWDGAAKIENAANGFRDAGLFPLDKNMVLRTDKFQASKLFNTPIASTSSMSLITKPTEPAEEAINQESTQSLLEAESVDQVEPITEHTDIQVIPPTGPEHEVNETVEPVTDGALVIPPTEPEHEVNETVEPATDGALPPASQLSNEEKDQQPILSAETESPLSKFLKIPEFKPKVSKSAKRELLPKAVTSDGFRNYLIEKKRKREQEEEAKNVRKLDRERKRVEKELDKKKKTEERKLKSEQNLLKKKEREDEKARKLKIKALLASQSQKQQSDSDSDDTDYSLKYLCEDSEECDDFGFQNDNKCFKCEGTDDQEGWVGCQRCFKFFHRGCTDIDFEGMTDKSTLLNVCFARYGLLMEKYYEQ